MTILPSRFPPAQPEPRPPEPQPIRRPATAADLRVPCPKCGAPLAFYFDPATGEEWYCEACAPACLSCGKKMVDQEAGPVCCDCVFWFSNDGPSAA
jgi:hypothetical protein